MSTSELASSYAALILADDGVEITVSYPGASPTPPRCWGSRDGGRQGTRRGAEAWGNGESGSEEHGYTNVRLRTLGRQAPDPHQGRRCRGR